MNKCIVCGKECKGKTCSGKCRAKLSRLNGQKAHGTQPIIDAHAHETGAHSDTRTLPNNYGQPDCECLQCQNNRKLPENKRLTINHGPHKPAHALNDNEVNRVPLPGDMDYKPTSDGVQKVLDDQSVTVYSGGAWT